MSQEQQSAPQEATQTPPADIGDIFADHMTEEAIGALLDDDKPEGGETPPTAQQPQPDAAPPQQQAQQPAEEQKPEEHEGDGKYRVEMFGREVDLEGDQLVDLVEAGAQLIQNRPQVEKAMTLMQAVQQDSGLQHILRAYSDGGPQAVHALLNQHMGQPQPAPQPGTPEEAVAQFKAQVTQEAMQQILQAIQQQYGPMVEKWNQTSEAYHQERAFAPFKSDPDYEPVNQCMAANVNQKLIEGKITHQEAAQIMQALKADPQLYGQWFPKFKDALTKARAAQAAPQGQPAQAPGRAPDGKFVSRAPKLESQAAAATETQSEIIGQRWKNGDRSGAFAATLMGGL